MLFSKNVVPQLLCIKAKMMMTLIVIKFFLNFKVNIKTRCL